MRTGREGARLGLAPGPEFDLIRSFFPRIVGTPREDVRVGAGDDCAVVVGSGIALSTDLSVEGVHFRREWLTPREIGYRAATGALSDLAAVAARPIGLLASLAVADADAGVFAVAVMEGAQAAVEAVGGIVLGGDLTRSPGPALLDVTVVGETDRPVLRSGARAGDEVWVTGELGAAALAVAHHLRGEPPPAAAAARFAAPSARVGEARWLQERAVLNAMVDLSDGLAGDAGHLAAAGGLAVLLERERIPVHPAVRERVADEGEALAFAVSGGEDYELCFAAAAGSVAPVASEFEAVFGLRLTRVGSVAEGDGVFWRAPDGSREPVGRGGFQHFVGA